MPVNRDIGWAVKKLKEGRRVRRPSWDQNRYWVLEEEAPGELSITEWRGPSRIDADIYDDHLLATDWVYL